MATVSATGVGPERVLTLDRTIRLQSPWVDPSPRQLLLFITDANIAEQTREKWTRRSEEIKMKKQTNPNIKAHLLRSGFCLILLVVVCVIPFALAQRTATRTLTFADRVAYQRAIEEVYWHHRIWPKENTATKPSLDAVMSQAQLEEKVAEYLRESQALEDYRHQPISSEQLQAEMDRIAHDTKQPEVLREIFDPLGNDPAVIAECLARPILVERLVRDLHAQGKLGVERTKSAMSSSPTMAAIVSMTYTLPVVTSAPTTCFDNWTATGDPGPEAPGRVGHTAVWTGS